MRRRVARSAESHVGRSRQRHRHAPLSPHRALRGDGSASHARRRQQPRHVPIPRRPSARAPRLGAASAPHRELGHDRRHGPARRRPDGPPRSSAPGEPVAVGPGRRGHRGPDAVPRARAGHRCVGLASPGRHGQPPAQPRRERIRRRIGHAEPTPTGQSWDGSSQTVIHRAAPSRHGLMDHRPRTGRRSSRPRRWFARADHLRQPRRNGPMRADLRARGHCCALTLPDGRHGRRQHSHDPGRRSDCSQTDRGRIDLGGGGQNRASGEG